MKKGFLGVIILYSIFNLYFSEDILASSSGAAFLKLGTSARSLGLGSAYTAVTDDVTSIFNNPAGIVMSSKKEFYAMHSRWIADINYDIAGFVMPSRYGSFGAGIIYLSQQGLEGRNENREFTGGFDASDMAFALTYGKNSKIINMSFGVTAKFIQQRIESYSSQGVAFDIGMQYKPIYSLPLKLGFAIQNIGTEMRFISESYNLPLTFSLGLSYNPIGVFLISSDIKHNPVDNTTDICFGTEYYIVNLLSIRAGYLHRSNTDINNSDNYGLPKGIGVGLGIYVWGSKLDYSFIPYGNLGDAHQVSLSISF